MRGSQFLMLPPLIRRAADSHRTLVPNALSAVLKDVANIEKSLFFPNNYSKNTENTHKLAETNSPFLLYNTFV